MTVQRFCRRLLARVRGRRRASDLDEARVRDEAQSVLDDASTRTLGESMGQLHDAMSRLGRPTDLVRLQTAAPAALARQPWPPAAPAMVGDASLTGARLPRLNHVQGVTGTAGGAELTRAARGATEGGWAAADAAAAAGADGVAPLRSQVILASAILAQP